MIDTESRTVQPGDVDPRGRAGECGDCAADLGTEHDGDCPRRRRTVVVDFTVRMVMEVPESWTRAEVEDHFNEDRCHDALLDDLLELRDEAGADDPCLCGRTTAAFVGEATRADEQTYDVVRAGLPCEREGGGDA